ncbi:hypothetical protein [Streptomyces mexicanus]|uniref:hypothetical protein n=1 Tax=Streptomyces mexicanus TaxID=178566 RepID=UPI0036C68CA2
MRGLPARRIASTALCAAVLAGIGAPAALAADPAREHHRATAPRSPLPAADALLDRVEGLGDLGGRLAPVHDLLAAVLTADYGTLTVLDAKKLGDAAKNALAQLTLPPAAAPTGVHLLAPPQAPASPLARQRAADPVSDALAALQKALDSLLKAVGSGNVTQVLPAVTGLVGDLGKLVTGVLQGLAQPASPSAAPATATPSTTAPSTAAPATATPVTTLPAVTVPGVTEAGVSVPAVTLPEITLPKVTVPKVSAAAKASGPQTGIPAATAATPGTAPQAS